MKNEKALHGHKGSRAYQDHVKAHHHYTARNCIMTEETRIRLGKLKEERRKAHIKIDRETRCHITNQNIQTHKGMRDFYFNNPSEIEQGFRALGKEFGIADHGRIDIIGRDVFDNFCIVEIKSGRKPNVDRVLSQMIKYKEGLLKLFAGGFHCEYCFRTMIPHIRLILITADAKFDFGHSTQAIARGMSVEGRTR